MTSKAVSAPFDPTKELDSGDDPPKKQAVATTQRAPKGAIDSSTLKPNWSRGVYKISK